MWCNKPNFYHYRQGGIHESLDECKENAILLAQQFAIDCDISVKQLMKSFDMEIDDE